MRKTFGVRAAHRVHNLLPAVCLMLAAAGQLFAADTPRTSVLAPVADIAAKSLEKLNASDIDGAREILKGFEELWSPVEDSVRTADPAGQALTELRRPQSTVRLPLFLRPPAAAASKVSERSWRRCGILLQLPGSTRHRTSWKASWVSGRSSRPT
jgi:hypothetical protein